MDAPADAAAALATDLHARAKGRVITAADPDYDTQRAVFYGGIDARPGLILRAAGVDDVVAAVNLARDHRLELALRSGGHSVAGHSTTEGGLVLDLRDLKTIDIDPVSRTAWAGTGLTAVEFTKAAGEHNLAVGFGDAGSVGIGGITLGGGVGFLTRKHGLTIDSLLAAEIVTADGRTLTVDATDHPDLFWAIRGGGGNFGVVTRLKFRLHPLEQIYGGMIVLPATPETVAGFVAAAEAAPEELSAIGNVMPAPPMPFLPKELHGKLVIFGMIVYAGDVTAGEKAVAPFRALAKPHADMVKAMPLAGIYPPEDRSYRPTAVARNMFIDHVGLAEARRIVDTLAAYDAPMRVVQLRVLGGAMARVAPDATAYAHRSSRIMVNVAAFYAGAADRAARDAWVQSFADALDQGDHGVYVNFLAAEGPERIRAAYPGVWDRLAAIKRIYDPQNLFRLNQNIPPAKAS